MKKLGRSAVLCLCGWAMLLQTGCFGSFKLTMNLYEWNKQIDDKYVQQVVFWAMCIIPVYEAASIIDAVVLNTIEFWTGTNPIAMKPGDREEQIVSRLGINYRMVATQNQLAITPLNGKHKGRTSRMVYSPSNKTWNLIQDGKEICLSKIITNVDGYPMARVFGRNGSHIDIAAPVSQTEVAQQIHQLQSAAFANVAVVH